MKSKLMNSNYNNKKEEFKDICPFGCYLCDEVLGQDFLHSRYEFGYILNEKDRLIFDPMSERCVE